MKEKRTRMRNKEDDNTFHVLHGFETDTPEGFLKFTVIRTFHSKYRPVGADSKCSLTSGKQKKKQPKTPTNKTAIKTNTSHQLQITFQNSEIFGYLQEIFSLPAERKGLE